jgi:hypothetical protein
LAKKARLAAVLASAITAGIFAQEESGQNDLALPESPLSETLPQPVRAPPNTLTVDLGPTVVGAVFSFIGDMLKTDEDIREITDAIHSSGFGIALRYDRQISEKWGVGGRFSYIGCSLQIWDEEEFPGGGTETLSLDMSLFSFSLEAHVRYFPFKKRVFFVDGMLGYGYLEVDFLGDLVITASGGSKNKGELAFTASRNYFKYGIKLGWRIDFGVPGGFVFEPSFGYYGSVAFGKTIGEQVLGEIEDGQTDYGFDGAFKTLEDFIFVGGPRLSLAFGWRF